MKTKEKTALVKINSELYDKVRARVDKNPIEYPSIKHFVELSIMQMLGFKRYNVEGVDQQAIVNEPLKDVLKENKKNYAICIMCSRAFLKNKEDCDDKSRICTHCKKTILHFAEQLKE